MSISDQYQFDLDGVTFGQGCDIKVENGGFSPGSTDWRIQDTSSPTSGRRRFGRDYADGPTWAWTLYTDRTTDDEALASMESLATVWANENGREVAGNMRALRYSIGGRTRRVFGRPRRFAPTIDNFVVHGRVGIACDFVTADQYTYDDAFSSTVLSVTPATYSGFAVPATAPWPSLTAGSRGDTIVVGGTARTNWLQVRFDASDNATMYEPRVVIGDREYGIDSYILPGGSVTIDLYNQTVTGAASGALTKDTQLGAPAMKPGSYTASFSALDVSGLGRATVFWRAAHNGL